MNSVPIIWETPQERVVATCLSLAILATNSAKNQLISISMSPGCKAVTVSVQLCLSLVLCAKLSPLMGSALGT